MHVIYKLYSNAKDIVLSHDRSHFEGKPAPSIVVVVVVVVMIVATAAATGIVNHHNFMSFLCLNVCHCMYW